MQSDQPKGDVEEDKINQAVDVFNSKAEYYQTRFMDVSLYHSVLNHFVATLENEKPALLDVACGPGNVAQYLLQQLPAAQLLGIDLSPNMITLAQQHNPTAQFKVMDSRDIKQMNTKFDGIVASFAFPYLNETSVQHWLMDAYTVLKAGGCLYISTMEDEPTANGWKTGSGGEKIFMHFYNEQQLGKWLGDAGFHIKFIERICYPGRAGETITDLILIAQV